MAAPLPGPLFTGTWEYDVFVCFRGDDTRTGFASLVKDALSKRQIRAFMDPMLERTLSIDELIFILERSALSVVVFSERFADSSFCLDEIATIARSVTEFGHRVLPVFFKVNPSDVTDESGRYSADIDKLLAADGEAVDKKKRWMDGLKGLWHRVLPDFFKVDPPDVFVDSGGEAVDKKKRWMDGLKEVAKHAGYTTEKLTESELLEEIVGTCLQTLINMSPSVESNRLVNMGSRVWELDGLLAMDDVTDTRIVGLWGMAGSGKTTLAEEWYRLQTSFLAATNGSSVVKYHFIRNVSEKCEAQCGVDGLMLELYSQLLTEENLTRDSLNVAFRRRRLSDLKVYIVLDDVGCLWQLDQLLLGSIFSEKVAKLFAPGSRIIVTSRDKKVIEYGQVVKIHQVECLGDEESLKVFSLFAFGCSTPSDELVDLSRDALSYCGGNPLALRVLGGILRDEDRSYWQSFLKSLIWGRTGVPGIHQILRKSYDKLNVQQQPLFLDVACFLHGMLRSRLIYYTKTSRYDAHSDVTDLIKKSLLVCVDGKDGETIEVHDLLKDMAWQIVNEELDLKKRSRLENPEDISKLLQTPQGDRATEAINLNLSKAKGMKFEANTFEGMNSLKWLKFCWPHTRLGHDIIHIPGGSIDFLPAELRGLQWDRYPLRSLPSGFSPENLRILALRDSHIAQCWEQGESQAPMLVNLVELDLYGCKYLTVIPDLSKSKHLEVLILCLCESLVELPSYVGFLDKLVRLDVEDCSNLERIPARLNSRHLKYVWMSKCWKLTRCPDINSTELEFLDLDRTPINAAPPASIYNKMKQGGSLSLYCRQITSFPQVPARLESFCLSNTSITEIGLQDQDHSDSASYGPRFERLLLVDNSQLESLPVDLWKLVSREFLLEGSPLIEKLPRISETLEGFTRLAVTRCRLFKRVSSTIGNLKSLQVLTFSCTPIETLPPSIEELSELSTLELSTCSRLTSIPDVIHKLPKLSVLIVNWSKMLTSLPRLPPSLKLLSARFCKSLQALPSDIGTLRCPEMWFDCCSQLDRVTLDQMASNFPHQVMPGHFQGTRLYPGSELPDLFHYQGEEGEVFVKVTLPDAAANNEQKMNGIAFGVVTTSQPCGVMQQMICCCYLLSGFMEKSRPIAPIVAPWSCSILVGFDEDSSSHVHLWFGDNPANRRTTNEDQEQEEEEEAAWYVKHAGASVIFFFYSQDRELEIKRCGVSLLY